MMLPPYQMSGAVQSTKEKAATDWFCADLIEILAHYGMTGLRNDSSPYSVSLSFS